MTPMRVSMKGGGSLGRKPGTLLRGDVHVEHPRARTSVVPVYPDPVVSLCEREVEKASVPDVACRTPVRDLDAGAFASAAHVHDHGVGAPAGIEDHPARFVEAQMEHLVAASGAAADVAARAVVVGGVRRVALEQPSGSGD